MRNILQIHGLRKAYDTANSARLSTKMSIISTKSGNSGTKTANYPRNTAFSSQNESLCINKKLLIYR